MRNFPRVPNPPWREGQHATVFRGHVAATWVPRPRARDAGTPRPRARNVDIPRTPTRDERSVYKVPRLSHEVPHTGGSFHDVALNGDGHVDVQLGEGDDDDVPNDLNLEHGYDTPRPVPAKDIADQANFTAAQANNYTMVMAFGDADLARTEEDARRILLEHCPCGSEEEAEPMFTFTHYDGYLFQFGHKEQVLMEEMFNPTRCQAAVQLCLPRAVVLAYQLLSLQSQVQGRLLLLFGKLSLSEWRLFLTLNVM